MIKKLGRVALVLLLLLAMYVLYIMITTGFFREVSATYTGEITKYKIAGAEDMTLSTDESFLIISCDDRAGRRDGEYTSSGLYKLDVTDPNAVPRLLTNAPNQQLFPHGISLLQINSSQHRLMAISHQATKERPLGGISATHSIEEYVLTDTSCQHVKTHQGPLMKSPNDVVAVDAERFYFSNDHWSDTELGFLMEDYLGVQKSNIIYFDGQDYRIVAKGIGYANGITIDKDRHLLYLAAPREMGVKVYSILENGDLDFIEHIDCNTGVDNIELDQKGRLWIGCHPSLLTFASYAHGKRELSPSEIIVIDYRDQGDYDVKSVYMNDGTYMSAATTAVPVGDKVFVGNVMDDHFIRLDRFGLAW